MTMTPAKIAALRSKQKMSAASFARLIGLGNAGGRTVRYIENGEREPHGSTLMVLEMLELGELPKRYWPEPPRPRGRPPKTEGESRRDGG